MALLGLLAASATPAAAANRATGKPFFDSRERDRAPARARQRDPRVVVGVDRATGTARTIQRLDGALTAPAAGDRADVARRWLRANRDQVGITAEDVDELRLADRVTTPNGLTHLRFTQAVDGVPAFDNGVRVATDRGGRIVAVGGSALRAPRLKSTEPRLSAADAMRALQADVGVRRETRSDRARLVVFGTADGPRLAWHLTCAASSTAHYDAVVDATTGEILFRQNLVKRAAAAHVFPNFPNAPSAPEAIDFEARGWLAPGASRLEGPFVHTYSDTNDNDADGGNEQIQRTLGNDFEYPFTPAAEPPAQPDACKFPEAAETQTLPKPGWPAPLTSTAECSWVPGPGQTWGTNREQNGVQAFYLANLFHDHLKNPNIGFDAASGAFEGTESLLLETDDGAANGPDDDHLNNANMFTPPDGQRPRMQLYLFAYEPGEDYRYRNVNGGDDAATVWHEYTHGLSNRLVTRANGSGALSTAHAAAMGEGWSDWYAMDLLNRLGLETDTAAHGEIAFGVYTDAVFGTTRFSPVDCPVGSTAPRCPGGETTGPGGFTFADFGNVDDGPEEHADGEIWAQTLWDLRDAVGSDAAEKLITEAMRLSPPEPSFLEMRNAILVADTALGAVHRNTIWGVFAARGMGYYASVVGSSDTNPVESFEVPPDPNGPKGTIEGRVTLTGSGIPLGDVRVSFGTELSTTTGADGAYSLAAPAGARGALVFSRDGGYDTVAVGNVRVNANETSTVNAELRRDWAASAGGATVTSSDETGASFGCGAASLIDQALGTGWSAFNPSSPDPANPHAGPPTATIALPRAVDVESFGMDPGNTCNDDPSATTRDYRVETSSDGQTYQVAKVGTFATTDRGKLNIVSPTGGSAGVRFVRIVLLSPQSSAPGSSGRDFIDFSEFEVFGNARPQGSLNASPGSVAQGGTVTLDASSFSDADGTVAGYDWDFDGDGSTDRSTDSATTGFAYATAGTFIARVRVRDAQGASGDASAAVSVTQTPPVQPPVARPVALPQLTLPRTGTRGQIRMSVRCFARCTLTAKLVLSRAHARRLRVPRTIGTFRRTITSSASAQRITLRVTRRLREAARRRGVRTLTVQVSAKAAYADTRSTSAKRNVRVRR